jgi:hypothetical protein
LQIASTLKDEIDIKDAVVKVNAAPSVTTSSTDNVSRPPHSFVQCANIRCQVLGTGIIASIQGDLLPVDNGKDEDIIAVTVMLPPIPLSAVFSEPDSELGTMAPIPAIEDVVPTQSEVALEPESKPDLDPVIPILSLDQAVRDFVEPALIPNVPVAKVVPDDAAPMSLVPELIPQLFVIGTPIDQAIGAARDAAAVQAGGALVDGGPTVHADDAFWREPKLMPVPLFDNPISENSTPSHPEDDLQREPELISVPVVDDVIPEVTEWVDPAKVIQRNSEMAVDDIVLVAGASSHDEAPVAASADLRHRPTTLELTPRSLSDLSLPTFDTIVPVGQSSSEGVTPDELGNSNLPRRRRRVRRSVQRERRASREAAALLAGATAQPGLQSSTCPAQQSSSELVSVARSSAKHQTAWGSPSRDRGSQYLDCEP